MKVKKVIKQSIACISGGLLFGCSQNSLTPSKLEGLSQERLFFTEKVFVKSSVQPTVAYPKEENRERPTEKVITIGALAGAVVGEIAPRLIDKGIDIVSKSMVTLSGKNDEVRSIEARASNFFYKDAGFNMPNQSTPHLNILFVSAIFGEETKIWKPKGAERSLKPLNIVGKPNFYLEAKVFPIPGNKYMEIVPTYMFYNRVFNSKGSDRKRDLAINFSFYDLENSALESSSDNSLISKATIVFKDVEVGKEYGEKELVGVRTIFMEMPTISTEKKGYSGAYNLKINVTETRDVNAWLATLGESISASKAQIASQLYVTREERITLQEKLQKAKNELKIIELKIIKAKEEGLSEIEVLKLENKKIEAEAKVQRILLERGDLRSYK